MIGTNAVGDDKIDIEVLSAAVGGGVARLTRYASHISLVSSTDYLAGPGRLWFTHYGSSLIG